MMSFREHCFPSNLSFRQILCFLYSILSFDTSLLISYKALLYSFSWTPSSDATLFEEWLVILERLIGSHISRIFSLFFTLVKLNYTVIHIIFLYLFYFPFFFFTVTIVSFRDPAKGFMTRECVNTFFMSTKTLIYPELCPCHLIYTTSAFVLEK